MARKTDAQRANEALEAYYELGSNRSLLRLSKTTGISFDQLQQWSEGYGWEEKITSLELDEQRKIDKKYLEKTRQIRNRLTRQIELLLQAMERSSLGLPFEVRSPNDLRAVAQAYESLVRASVTAQTKGIEATKGDSPKTWSDLLSQSDIESPELPQLPFIEEDNE